MDTNHRPLLPYVWGKTIIPPGESADLDLTIGESSTGLSVHIPVHIRRGLHPGPTLLVTAALHGDEINGTGAIREVILDDSLGLISGTLMLVPVLNVLGFCSYSRYLPDRRDLNRSFPGSSKGSLAARLARRIMQQLVARADKLIDLHTAAVRRTNFPNVRADTRNPEVMQLARSFGGSLIIHGQGPNGSLRRTATHRGCPAITFEGGEIWKVEPTVVEYIIRGIHNVMADLQMIDRPSTPSSEPFVLTETSWVRADRGGFLDFHVAPGDMVRAGQPIATNSSLLGQENNVLIAPFTGIVVGMTTLPAVSTGEAVCHLGKLPKSIGAATLDAGLLVEDRIEQQIQDDLATNVRVVEHPDSP